MVTGLQKRKLAKKKKRKGKRAIHAVRVNDNVRMGHLGACEGDAWTTRDCQVRLHGVHRGVEEDAHARGSMHEAEEHHVIVRVMDFVLSSRCCRRIVVAARHCHHGVVVAVGGWAMVGPGGRGQLRVRRQRGW